MHLAIQFNLIFLMISVPRGLQGTVLRDGWSVILLPDLVGPMY
jgi:hypothetical protein